MSLWNDPKRFAVMVAQDRDRKRVGQEAVYQLLPEDAPSTTDETLYALAREVLALRERVAALEAKEGRDADGH